MSSNTRCAIVGMIRAPDTVPRASPEAKLSARKYLQEVGHYMKLGRFHAPPHLSEEQQSLGAMVACNLRIFDAICLQRFRQSCDDRYLVLMYDLTTGETMAVKKAQLADAAVVGKCGKDVIRRNRSNYEEHLDKHIAESTWNVLLVHSFIHNGKVIKVAMVAFHLPALQRVREYASLHLNWPSEATDESLVRRVIKYLHVAGVNTRYDPTQFMPVYRIITWLMPCSGVLDRQCNKCGPASKVMRCTGCNLVCYCSVKCQASDWLLHKAMCRSAALAREQGQAFKYVSSDDLFPVLVDMIEDSIISTLPELA